MKQIDFNPDAHPMAQEIAKPMHQKFIELTEIK